MSKLGSLFVIVFLAVFAAGTIVHAVSANAMALDMAMSEDGATSMADYQGCIADEGGNAGVVACDLACTAPILGTLGNSAGWCTLRSWRVWNDCRPGACLRAFEARPICSLPSLLSDQTPQPRFARLTASSPDPRAAEAPDSCLTSRDQMRPKHEIDFTACAVAPGLPRRRRGSRLHRFSA